MSEALEKEGLEEMRKKLKALKTKLEKADDKKARMMLDKLEEDDLKIKAQQEMMEHLRKQDHLNKEFTKSLDTVKGQILQLSKQKQDLMDKLRKCRADLDLKRSDTSKLKQKFKISALIPSSDVNFVGGVKEQSDEADQLISGVFCISQRAAVALRGGQAIITFEEEKVASQIVKMKSCLVSCENSTVNVKPKAIAMDTGVKFEVHLDVSRRDLRVFNIPPSLPDDRMKDRLGLSFSRPSVGGGEVEAVEYDSTTQRGRVTFSQAGVAWNLALRGRFDLQLDSEVPVGVEPAATYCLQKFQTFCGSTGRSVLLDGIEEKEDEEDLQDHLEIHFQKPSNNGGEIESIKYIAPGKSLKAFFTEDGTETDE